MAKIKKILAREILDSRGNPTIEAKVVLDNNLEISASAPSGASTGKSEALELRDNDLKRYNGKGSLKACENVEKIISPALIDKEVTLQKEIDKKMIELDGTENKSKLGANAILACSLAVAKAGAVSEGWPLYWYLNQLYSLGLKVYQPPIPMFNVINGGKHSDSGLTLQEFMIIPMAGDSFKERLRIGVEVFWHLRDILTKRGLSFAVGDEGGFAPKLKTTKNVLDHLALVSEFAKHSLGGQIFFGLDSAASVFYQEKEKKYLFEGKKLTAQELIKIYRDYLKKYPLTLLEDPLAEEDWENWKILTEEFLKIDPNLVIVGDDLYATNLKRLERGIGEKSSNTVLIKPNQIGTLSETIDCIKKAKEAKFKVIISHRSGETNDTFISDLTVAVGADFIKAGAPNRGERVAKYNRLVEIEEELIR